MHNEPFFPELFSFYFEIEKPFLCLHLKAALPEERAAHASSTAFSRRRTGSDLSVVFFVSSAKTHAKYDSCASHAEHEIFCCFSHSITCICGRCFICQIAGSIIFVRSIARIGTIILSRIVSTRYLFRFKLRFLLRFLFRLLFSMPEWHLHCRSRYCREAFLYDSIC